MNEMCTLCPLVIIKREFYRNLLVIDTYAFDVKLGMDWFGIFHIVIDCQKMNIVFRVLNNLEFEFVGGSNQVEPTEFRACSKNDVLTHLEAVAVEIPLVLEFIDVFEDFSRLMPDAIVELAIDLFKIHHLSLRHRIEWI